MARFQVQGYYSGCWIDEPTDVVSRRDRNIAIGRAKVIEADARVWGGPTRVRVVRLGWFGGQTVDWEYPPTQ